MPTNKPSRSSKNKSISIPTEKEMLEHRNRPILLNHVENAWTKSVLDASLHGAALLDLVIKQDPEEAIQYQYSWVIKKESTDETLPAGWSMIGFGDFIFRQLRWALR